jgi:predicted 3-demethylubiquinone-9 3-methyltransferase (glyoxalase superfamily)
MKSITPCLWFDDNLEEAIEFYASVFPDVNVHSVNRNPDGSAFTADFEIAGQRLMGLNGGPHFHFTEAISMFVRVEGQEELDRYWDALTVDGGEESQCGWLKDKFGLSWQIVPVEFLDMMSSGDEKRSRRAFDAMMKMRKLDIASLQAAYDG